MNAKRSSQWLGWLLAVGAATPAWAGSPFNALPPHDQLALVLLVVSGGLVLALGLLALTLFYSILRPERLRRGAEMLRVHPYRSLCAGVLAGLILLGGLVLAKALGPAGGLFGIALLLVYGYLLVSGLSIVAFTLGERLQASLETRGQGAPARAVAWGGVLLAGCGLVPIAGWLVQLVVVLCGLGAAVATLFAGRPAPVPAPAPAPPSRNPVA